MMIEVLSLKMSPEGWKALSIVSILLGLFAVFFLLMLFLVFLKEEEKRGVYLKDNQYLLEKDIVHNFGDRKPYCIEVKFRPDSDEQGYVIGLGGFTAAPEEPEEPIPGRRGRLMGSGNSPKSLISLLWRSDRKLEYVRTTEGLGEGVPLVSEKTIDSFKKPITVRINYDGIRRNLLIYDEDDKEYATDMLDENAIGVIDGPLAVGQIVQTVEGSDVFKANFPFFRGEIYHLKVWAKANPTKNDNPRSYYEFTVKPDGDVFKDWGMAKNTTMVRKSNME